ncbi:hypothetical protein II5_05939, partial [Bacillus cereus MSX-A1]
MWKFVKLLFSTRINNMDKIILFILATQLLLISTRVCLKTISMIGLPQTIKREVFSMTPRRYELT